MRPEGIKERDSSQAASYEVEVGPTEIDDLFRVHIAEQRWSVEQIAERQRRARHPEPVEGRA
jgi:hypothetical protein